MSFSFSIRGLQRAQQANLRHIQSLRGGSDMNEAVRWGAASAHRAAIPATPWDTTALRNSHRIDFQGSDNRACVHIDPGAVNPHGQRPAIYGPQLHRQGLRPGRKGGIRAFYRYVWQTYGAQIAQGMARFFVSRFRQ